MLFLVITMFIDLVLTEKQEYWKKFGGKSERRMKQINHNSDKLRRFVMGNEISKSMQKADS